jgi:hypothetical protein
MILYRLSKEFNVNTTRELANFLEVEHKDVLKAYDYLDALCVDNRDLISCGLRMDSEGVSYFNLSPSLIGMIMVKLNKLW